MSLICRRSPQKGAARLALVALAALVLSVPGSAGAQTTQTISAPETGSGTTGSSQSIVVRLGAVSTTDVQIDAEITGPNDPDTEPGYSPLTPDVTCTVAANLDPPECTLAFTPAAPALTAPSVADTFRIWVDADGSDATTEADETEGADESLEPGGVAEPDSTEVVVRQTNAQTALGYVLDCKNSSTESFPKTESSLRPNTGPSSKEIYTCTVTLSTVPQGNITIDVENVKGANDVAESDPAAGDYTCTTDATTGTCTVPIPAEELTNGEVGPALLCFWIDDNSDNAFDATNPSNGAMCSEPYDVAETGSGEDVPQTDVLRTEWEAPVPTNLDLTPPENGSVNLETAQQAAFKATLKDQFANLLEGVNVDFRVLAGPNRLSAGNMFECTTAADGTCTGTLASAEPHFNGIDDVCAWHDADGDNVYDPAGGPEDGGDCAGEPASPEDDDGGLTDREQVTWTNGAPFPTQLEMTPETVIQKASTQVVYTITVTDEQGQPIDAANVDVEITGAGDIDGDTPDTPDKTCDIGEGDDGVCTITFSSNVVGDAQLRAWVDIDDDDNGLADEEVDSAEGPDAGGAPDEPAGSPDVPGDLAEPDATDVVAVKWTASPTAVTIGYSNSVIEYGQGLTLSGVLTAGGQPLAGKSVVIQRRVPSSASFVTLATSFTDGTGKYTWTGRPGGTAEYRASFTGEPPALLASTSSVIKVAVRVIISTTASPTNASRGTAVAFTGKVIPVHQGKRVYLQVAGPNNSWRNVATTVCDGTGGFRMTYRRNAAGTLNFRILYPSGQDADHGGNYSQKFSIRWA